MTGEDLFYAWAVIDNIAKTVGVPPAEARGKMKEKLAKQWEDEECGKETEQLLHTHFSSPPSVEAVLVLMRDLAIWNDGQ